MFRDFFFFYSEFRPVQDSSACRDRGQQRHRLGGYVREIMVNLRFELVMVVAIGKASPWESVPLSNDSREKADRVEITSHQWNTKRMRMVC